MKTYTWKEAFAQALGAARTGNPGAQNFVGYCYDAGRGTQRDSKEAKYWYEQAARNGNVDGIFNLALTYEKRALRRNARRAVRLYERAAQRGDAEAQTNLAVMLLEGDGTNKDAAAAIRWLRLAARKGDTKAHFNLYLAYRDGEGVRRSDARAEYWLRRAAKGGHMQARRMLKSRRARTRR